MHLNHCALHGGLCRKRCTASISPCGPSAARPAMPRQSTARRSGCSLQAVDDRGEAFACGIAQHLRFGERISAELVSVRRLSKPGAEPSRRSAGVLIFNGASMEFHGSSASRCLFFGASDTRQLGLSPKNSKERRGLTCFMHCCDRMWICRRTAGVSSFFIGLLMLDRPVHS